jgi:hypothetical protein
MSWRPHSQAHVNPSRPRAWAQCDRCDRTFNHNQLQWQFQYAGPTLQNLRLLVCHDCLDTPQAQLKPRILPPDPLPIMNARPMRPDGFDIDSQVTQNDESTVTDDGEYLVGQNVANNREDAS